jgi:hypothetical protein
MNSCVKELIRKEHYALMLLCTYVPLRLQVNPTKDYVRNFQQKMQNEPNLKDRIQNAEYRRQNKKICTSVCPIKDCVAIYPADSLECYQVIISGNQETKPNYFVLRSA